MAYRQGRVKIQSQPPFEVRRTERIVVTFALT